MINEDNVMSGVVNLLLATRDKRAGIYIDGVCLDSWIPNLTDLVGWEFICSGCEKWVDSDDNIRFRIDLTRVRYEG